MSAYLLSPSTLTTSRRRSHRAVPSDSLQTAGLGVPPPPRVPDDLRGLALRAAALSAHPSVDDAPAGGELVEPVTRTIRPAADPAVAVDLRDLARRHSGLVAVALVGALAMGVAAIAAATPALARLEGDPSMSGIEALAAARLGGPRTSTAAGGQPVSAGAPAPASPAASPADEAVERRERVRRALRDELAATASAAAPACRVRDMRYRGDLVAEVVVEPTGRVSSLTLSGPPSLDLRAGACLDGRLRAAALPAFDGEPLQVTVYGRL